MGPSIGLASADAAGRFAITGPHFGTILPTRQF